MRKSIPLLLLSVMLYGCSSDETSHNSVANATGKETINKVHSTDPIEKNSKAKSISDIYVPNPQVSNDTNLLNVGDVVKDDKGEITLKGIAPVNKTFTVGPVQMKIKNIKYMQNMPTYSLMDYFHSYTENYEKFNFVKVEIELVNKSAETVHFGPVAHLKTSNDETKQFNEDFYIEYLSGEIGPKGSKQGAMGFILENSTQDLKWIEIVTSDVLDQNQKKIGKAQSLRFHFNS